MILSPLIEVTEPQKRFLPNDNVDGVRPSHHLNDSKTMFGNPWPSFRYSNIVRPEGPDPPVYYVRSHPGFNRPSSGPPCVLCARVKLSCRHSYGRVRHLDVFLVLGSEPTHPK